MCENAENDSLYTLLNRHGKHSILKSAYLKNDHIGGKYRLIEVEPWDITGENALNTTPKRYDNAINSIERAIKQLNKKLHEKYFFISIYGMDETFEYIFEPATGKTY